MDYKYLGTTVFLNSLDACVYRMVLVRSPKCRYTILAHRAIKEIYDAIELDQSQCHSVLELCVSRIPLLLQLPWNFEDIGNEIIASSDGVIKLNKKKIGKWRKQ